jgi:hypothetical protein
MVKADNENTPPAARCDCCRAEVHETDPHGACFVCSLARAYIEMIETCTDLGSVDAINLTGDLIDHTGAALLTRLKDRGASCSEFISDVASGMAGLQRGGHHG